MSKNFELLQQAEKDQELRRPSPPGASPAARTAGGAGPLRLRLAERTLEESVRLVQQLFVSPKEASPRVVVFTSANPGAGTTTVLACAAEALLTQVGGTICLVDGNMQHATLHKVFGLENRRGLSDALSQAEPPIRTFIQPTENPRLSVLSSGVVSGFALMNTEALAVRMAQLRREFDYVLVDSPPANMNAEALALCHVADGALLVLQAEVTHRAATRKTADAIEASGVRVLGAVLNQRRYPIPQGLYDRL